LEKKVGGDLDNNRIVQSEGKFTGQGGLELFTQSWQNPKQPVRAVFIILHGLKDHSGRYLELANAAVSKGFAVHAFDMRGHGRSAGKKAYVAKFEYLVDDLAAFTKQVKEKNPGKPVFIFGHSMGGTTITLTAVTHAVDFDGIVLSAAALVPGEGISPFLIRITNILGKIFPYLPLMNLPNNQFSRDPAVVQAMASDPFILNKNNPVRTAAQLLKGMKEIQNNIERFTAPVLILHGTADKLTNPAGSKQLSEKAKSADKTLKLYPGLVHDLVHEPEKTQVLADVIAWLDARAPKTR
jgi:alpha-beta hydrolase superfamily lysophospholipase